MGSGHRSGRICSYYSLFGYRKNPRTLDQKADEVLKKIENILKQKKVEYVLEKGKRQSRGSSTPAIKPGWPI